MRVLGSSSSSFFLVAVVLSACGGTSSSDAGTGGGSGTGGGTGTVTPAFTVHYHRAANDYAGWAVHTTSGAVEASAAAGATDGWGTTFPLTVASGASTLTFSLQGAGASEPGSFSVDVSGSIREVWVVSGFKTPIVQKPPAIPGANQVAVYYHRADGTYAQWGLHLWGDQAANTAWTSPLPWVGTSEVLGAGFLVDLTRSSPSGNCAPGNVCLIAHKQDTKEPNADLTFKLATLGNIVFVASDSTVIRSAPAAPGAVAIANASAHFLRRDVVAWDVDVDAGASFELRWSATPSIAAAGSDVVGGQVIALQPAGQVGADATLAAVAKNLAAFAEFTLDAGDLAIVKQALQGQLVAVARGSDGGVLSATNVQIGAALDDLYAYEGPLGVAWFDGGAPTLALWAPTARSVVLNVFDEAKVAVASQPMSQGASGVWSLSGPASWTGKYYQYQVTVYHPVSNKVETFNVTDPYSVNLSTNGVYSQIVDLADPALQPPGWTTFAKPPLAAPEDIVIYESHIRDFSTLDPTVPAEQAGKFLAFASDGGARTAGQQHLQALARSGLTHVHLLPAFDIATVDEDATHRVDLRSPYADLCLKIPGLDGGGECAPHAGQTVLDAYRSYPGNSDQQQRLAGLTRAYDAYNWGYDPFHYGAIEGSYASTAEGTAKIVEFRQMVQGLSALGLRTVMDVVYNHTNASGPTSDKSVLDRVVPGYYHRLDQTSGVVLTSSCCSNTATERRMMERLMVDTLVRWARDFKVDGFRFDLMGFHTTSNLAKVRAALDALTLAQDGVDGHAIYLYGEGWDAPEVNDRGVSANQVNMAGTGVGTFNDRLRDAVRGGGPFDNGSDFRKNQGFSNGLYYDPNELDDGGIVVNKTITPTLQQLLTEGDLIKVGMAGSLREFRLQTRTGSITAGGAIGYNGARAGYTLDPQESINYVSAHDNQTLWDILAYKLPTGTPTVDRVRAYDVALDTVLLGQGIPFFHLGDDVLRSKSMDKNSYDSGDWFNQVDWSGHTNGWKSGLPNGPDDQANWSTILPIFADATAAVSQANISAASDHFREMLRIRTGSPLFRLRTKAEVMTRVDFFNTGPGQIPGVIAMTLTDAACAGADLDPVRDALVVVLNADKVAHDVTIPGASGFTLHTVLQASTDPVVRTASVSGAVFTVPARTSAVFEQLQGGSRGSGLPCNTR